MKFISVSIAFLLVTEFIDLQNAENHCDCGKFEYKTNSRIYLGTKADPKRFPWQILIMLNKDINTFRVYGGVLISQRHIVTCAHFMENSILNNQE